MPTSEQIADWAAAHSRVYPDELPDRLEWFVREIGVSPERLLLLMGRPAEEAKRLAAQGVDWERVIAEDHYGAKWAEECLMAVLREHHYNRQAMAERLRHPETDDWLVT